MHHPVAFPILTPEQGYELAESEVKISLDDFKTQYCNIDGSVLYVFCFAISLQTSSIWIYIFKKKKNLAELNFTVAPSSSSLRDPAQR